MFFICIDGYSRNDIVHRWQDMSEGKKPVQIHEGISMAQFRLIGFEYGNKTLDENHGLGITLKSSSYFLNSISLQVQGEC